VFGAQARFRRTELHITGVSSAYVRVGDEGSRTTFHFCPQCGATVHYQLESYTEQVAVPVGAFSEPGFSAPLFSVYEERMHPWFGLPVGIERMA
jgi:hypothetical protein